MSRTTERLIGFGLGTLAVGILWWHTPGFLVDVWEGSWQVTLWFTLPVTVLGLLSIYLLLRPGVSK